MRRLLLPAAWACTAGGCWALHRLGREGRAFVASLAAELITDTIPHRRHP